MPETPPKKHEEYGLRLKIAVHRRFRRAAEFTELLEDRGVVKPGAFYFHMDGSKRPRDAKITRDYEALLGVPRGWIEVGDHETIEELRDALEALLERDNDHPLLTKLARAATDAVNHDTQQNGTGSGKSSEIRHIPILSHHAISALVAGEKVIADFLANTLPIPAANSIGPRAFVFIVPASDVSMSGPGDPSFPPGTELIIDPDQSVRPGEYGLFRTRRGGDWMLRRYKGAGPLDAAAGKYSLEALNPFFEAIRVSSGVFCEYAGRAVRSTRAH